jgi:hypothetical protein
MEMTTSTFVINPKHAFNLLDDYQLLVTMDALAILNIVIVDDNQ